jgi:hypothetical protein
LGNEDRNLEIDMLGGAATADLSCGSEVFVPFRLLLVSFVDHTHLRSTSSFPCLDLLPYVLANGEDHLDLLDGFLAATRRTRDDKSESLLRGMCFARVSS